MESTISLSQKANNYRKLGDYEKAIPIYKDLWENTHDIYAGTGYLHCLRKINEIEIALDLADVLINSNAIIAWTRNEILWLYINNVIKTENTNISLQKACSTATMLLGLDPDDVQNDSIVFWILKLSNGHKDWKLLNEWIDKINYKNLSSEPLIINGKEGWSKKAIWYHYKIKSIIFNDRFKDDEFNQLMSEALDSFPKQRKFFIRLEAIAYSRQGDYVQTEKIYKDLCNSKYVDWWILHDYAQFKIKIDDKQEALKLMFIAVNEKGKLDSKINLIKDIAVLCEGLELYEISYLNYLLYRSIKERNNWKIEREIDERITGLKEHHNFIFDTDYKSIYQKCVNIWRNSGISKDNADYNKKHKQTGYVKLGRNEQTYCFIKIDERESIFCLKSDLPTEIVEGSKVEFDVEPSYDKKKGIESTKAINISLLI